MCRFLASFLSALLGSVYARLVFLNNKGSQKFHLMEKPWLELFQVGFAEHPSCAFQDGTVMNGDLIAARRGEAFDARETGPRTRSGFDRIDYDVGQK